MSEAPKRESLLRTPGLTKVSVMGGGHCLCSETLQDLMTCVKVFDRGYNTTESKTKISDNAPRFFVDAKIFEDDKPRFLKHRQTRS